MSFLFHSIDGKVVSKTLCTSHYHANNIWRKMLERLDSFTRNGEPISAVWEDRFCYSPR